MSDGVHAHASVNIDSSEAVGENIISKIVGATAPVFSFKQKDQAVAMAGKSADRKGQERWFKLTLNYSFKGLLLQARAT